MTLKITFYHQQWQKTGFSKRSTWELDTFAYSSSSIINKYHIAQSGTIKSKKIQLHEQREN